MLSPSPPVGRKVWFPSVEYEKELTIHSVDGSAVVPLFLSKLVCPEGAPRLCITADDAHGKLAGEDKNEPRAVSIRSNRAYVELGLVGVKEWDLEVLFLRIGPTTLSHRRDLDWFDNNGQLLVIVVNVRPPEEPLRAEQFLSLSSLLPAANKGPSATDVGHALVPNESGGELGDLSASAVTGLETPPTVYKLTESDVADLRTTLQQLHEQQLEILTDFFEKAKITNEAAPGSDCAGNSITGDKDDKDKDEAE